MKTNNEIVLEIIKNLDDIINIYCWDLEFKDDLKNDILLDLLIMDNEKINNIYDKKYLKVYLVGMVNNNVNSITSPYYKKYKKYSLLKKDYCEEYGY
jgi:predicted nucleotidyltransferase